MKKLLTMLVLAGFAFTNADAQNSYVCKRTKAKSTSCYKTKYNQNFKICKDAYGYRICGQERTYANSTQPALPIVPSRQSTPVYSMRNSSTAMPQDIVPQQLTAPQNQSYPFDYNGDVVIKPGVYHGYYPKKSNIKVCYFGDNVGELNRAPYKGCTTPAWDGPERNNRFNLNVSNSNSLDLAPVDGGISER
jgi:hypothetical protein